jgi:hypothetical protein
MGFIILNVHLKNANKDSKESYPSFDTHNPVREHLDDTPPLKPAKSENKIKPILPERQYMQHESQEPEFTGIIPTTSLGQPLIDSSVDSANCEMVKERTRDKRAQTSATIKDANFYKKYYGNEFEEAEKRLWWGNGE